MLAGWCGRMVETRSECACGSSSMDLYRRARRLRTNTTTTTQRQQTTPTVPALAITTRGAPFVSENGCVKLLWGTGMRMVGMGVGVDVGVAVVVVVGADVGA